MVKKAPSPPTPTDPRRTTTPHTYAPHTFAPPLPAMNGPHTDELAIYTLVEVDAEGRLGEAVAREFDFENIERKFEGRSRCMGPGTVVLAIEYIRPRFCPATKKVKSSTDSDN